MISFATSFYFPSFYKWFNNYQFVPCLFPTLSPNSHWYPLPFLSIVIVRSISSFASYQGPSLTRHTYRTVCPAGSTRSYSAMQRERQFRLMWLIVTFGRAWGSIHQSRSVHSTFHPSLFPLEIYQVSPFMLQTT